MNREKAELKTSILEKMEKVAVWKLEELLEAIHKDVVISNGRIVEVCGK